MTAARPEGGPTGPDPVAHLGAAIRDRWASVRGPLFCDMYELTMAQVYVRTGLAHRPARFDAFYRSNPDYGKIGRAHV